MKTVEMWKKGAGRVPVPESQVREYVRRGYAIVKPETKKKKSTKGDEKSPTVAKTSAPDDHS